MDVSESDEGTRWCKQGVTGVTGAGQVTGAGVGSGEGDNDESADKIDKFLVIVFVSQALLLVMRGTLLEGR